jgi:hypothetical protein
MIASWCAQPHSRPRQASSRRRPSLLVASVTRHINAQYWTDSALCLVWKGASVLCKFSRCHEAGGGEVTLLQRLLWSTRLLVSEMTDAAALMDNRMTWPVIAHSQVLAGAAARSINRLHDARWEGLFAYAPLY